MLGFHAITESAFASQTDTLGHVSTVVGTTALGSISVTGTASISITGLSATLSQGSVIVWGLVLPGVTTTYSNVNTSNSPTWSTVSTGASQIWTEVA